jgi:hypothetical protein
VSEIVKCLLCKSDQTGYLFSSKASQQVRPFYRCANCDLVFVPSAFHVDVLIEQAKYEKHNNSLSNQGYLQLLMPVAQLADELARKSPQGAKVLDFGCGPQPALAELLTDYGHSVEVYDPIFYPDRTGHQSSYPVITCTEVVEHFSDPPVSWSRLFSLLAPGGHAVVMTQLTDPQADLEKWHYIRDITHVSFYSRRSLQWIADQWQLQLQWADKNLAHFRKP